MSNQRLWPDRFYIIIMEYFVAELQKFLLVKCPPAAMSKEKCMCSQASGEIEQLRGLFGFILLLFAMNVVMGYQEKAHTCF